MCSFYALSLFFLFLYALVVHYARDCSCMYILYWCCCWGLYNVYACGCCGPRSICIIRISCSLSSLLLLSSSSTSLFHLLSSLSLNILSASLCICWKCSSACSIALSAFDFRTRFSGSIILYIYACTCRCTQPLSLLCPRFSSFISLM